VDKGQDIIIHFSGNLSASMAHDVDAKISAGLVPNSRFIFDFSKLASAEPEGAKLMEILCMKIENSNSLVVFSGLKLDFFGFCPEQLPCYTNIEDAKLFFSKKIAEEVKESRGDGDTPQTKPENDFPAIHCPSCGTYLNIRGKGNYGCPSCKIHFFIHSNGRISKYEKLL